jgi:hypothetical protein
MTIKESRQIEFDAEELCACLQQNASIAVQLGIPFLDRPLVLEFCPTEHCIAVRYDTNEGAESLPVKVGGSKLAVLLMKWCDSRKIPLPRGADKSVYVTDVGVKLNLESRWGPAVDSQSGRSRPQHRS